MLSKKERIAALSSLPAQIRKQAQREEILTQAYHKNQFFIPAFSEKAINAILAWHTAESLTKWLEKIPEERDPKKVGLVLAGNIPLVGWHDLLSVFAAGHVALYKPSTADEVLTDWFLEALFTIEPKAREYFRKVERMTDVDSLIATGSNATAAHFNHYFAHIPRLIRGAKTSLGVIYGFESEEELAPLADDLMLYFGMGCRNVTKILVPEGYDFAPLFNALERYRFLTDHHKYVNNCIYHKSIFLMNGDPFLESDIVTIRPAESVFSPVGVINYEAYSDLAHARRLVAGHKNDLQCVVSHKGEFEESIPFGTAQTPAVDDYADGKDTLAFLGSL